MQNDLGRALLGTLIAVLLAAPAAQGAYWHEQQRAGSFFVRSVVAGDGSATTLGSAGVESVWAPVSRPGEIATEFPTVATAEWRIAPCALATNSSGRTVALVVEHQQATATNILKAVVRDAGAWGVPHEIGIPYDTDGGVASVSPDGTITVLWNGQEGLRATVRSAAGVWSSAQTLQPLEGGFAFAPQLVVDASGLVTAAWHTSGGIHTATRPSGGSWSAPVTVGAPELSGPDRTSDVRELVLAAEPGGGARIVANARTRGNFFSIDQIWAMRRAGGTWSAPAVLDGESVEKLSLSVNATGQGLAAWVRMDPQTGKYSVRAADAAAGAAFGAPADLDLDTLDSRPAVALQDSGAAMIATHTPDNLVRYQERGPGGAFGAVQTVPRQAGDAPTLAVAPGGRYLLTVGNEGTARFTALSRPPIAVISRTGELQRGVPYALGASGSSDPDGTISSYAWDLDGDGAFDDDSDANASVTLTVTGTHPVALRVVDSSGEPRVTRLALELPPVPAAPDFSYSPAAPLSGEQLTFTSTGTGPDGGPSTPWQWSLNPLDFDAGTSMAASPTYTFHLPGTYQVGLVTTDGAHVTKPVVIGNRAPTAVFSGPGSASARTLVEFDGSTSFDPDAPSGSAVRRYEWDLDGDGTHETDMGGYAKAVAVYAQGGTVAVGLKVTDLIGGTDTTSHPLIVSSSVLRSALSAPSAGTPAGVARLVAGGARSVRFHAGRAGVLSVRVVRKRRTLAAGALVFRRGGAQVLRLARFGSRGGSVRVTWTPRGGRPKTVSRALRSGS